MIAPDKPWFTYLCPGAGHAPHHVFKEWADKYAGKFDMGYEKYREVVLERQKSMGSCRRTPNCRPSIHIST
ncbi:sulfatase family protein [Mycobacterium kansasii]|uniref:Sulfatase family protein n=1 Tax=Mycobacterium kansasii TaxID=1768 RepID=A0A1V3WK65_MYCKA|nr:sulfatase family protein [Mycobacterium kansasii]